MSAGRILVTGGCGFIGSNLVDELSRQGHPVTILDAMVRPGVEHNLSWLRERHGSSITFIEGDVRDQGAVRHAMRDVGAVFHLAAQVAVTTSFSDPRSDFETNVLGTLNLLEAIRLGRTRIPFLFASTNKVYGDLADVELELHSEAYRPVSPHLLAQGIGEDRPLDFHTPYGCSKGAADQYVLDYARSFEVPAAVMRMSCIYGPRQMGTEDQGWVAHFAIRALRGEPITLFGDGMQVRDILSVEDAVAAYIAAWRRIDAIAGQAFNLGGGCPNTVSLLQLLRFMESSIGRTIEVRFEDWRPGDQRYYVSDIRRASEVLGIAVPMGWRQGVTRLIEWLGSESPLVRPFPETRLTVEAAE